MCIRYTTGLSGRYFWAEDWPCSTAQHQVTRLDLTFGTATKNLRQQSQIGPSSGGCTFMDMSGRQDGGRVDCGMPCVEECA